ncbi:MAG TPA: putative 2OG-Fe(II) oxygenase [Sphingomicrobium sp.]|jgi:tetratricopeptide (TPR) repeat protein|nr:putative 2OG-Fe(II) oxygenase [Sphingomicrobium sp.]
MDSLASQNSVDQGIALYRKGMFAEARTSLRALVAQDSTNVTAWNVLGFLERDIGDAAGAAAAFDKALQLQPNNVIALKGRARMALERAEEDAVDRYEAALLAAPGDLQLMLEQTEARVSAGDDSAIDDFAEFVERRPEWTDGQVASARMLWESRRDQDFADHIHQLLKREPARLDLRRQLIELLSTADMYEAAADSSHSARSVAPGIPEFALMEAVNAGRAGDLDRASGAFALLPPNFPGRAIHDSVHHIRCGKLDAARASIEVALGEDPSDIAAWGVAELIYRKLGDRRAAWLSGQPGLVRSIDLTLEPAELSAIRTLLLRLQQRGIQVAGQTVRDGTQTRWRLFDRADMELAILKQAVELAVSDYLAGLPAEDPTHPLLRHRNSPMTITGSWSVLLTGNGHHISHVHPLGLIGSACYIVVPDAATDEGQLELGRPPKDFMLDLEPIHVIAAKPGRLVLFPSYLHHGTRPFGAGQRLSVAFDVHRNLAPGT